MNYSNITVVGRITREPEHKFLDSGKQVVKFSIAVDRRGKPGAEKVADFFDVEAWEFLAEFVNKYLGKGRNVIVVGKPMNDKYVDKNGENRVKFKIVANEIMFNDKVKKEENDGE